MIDEARQHEIAAVALRELEHASERKVTGDDLLLARVYAKKGHAYIDALSDDLSPSVHAVTLADEAITEYVKARLSGARPVAYAPFAAALRRWGHRARTLFERAAIDEEREKEKEEKERRLASRLRRG